MKEEEKTLIKSLRAESKKIQNTENMKEIKSVQKNNNPILERESAVLLLLLLLRHAQGTPPLDSETGWTAELWSNPVLLILEN